MRRVASLQRSVGKSRLFTLSPQSAHNGVPNSHDITRAFLKCIRLGCRFGQVVSRGRCLCAAWQVLCSQTRNGRIKYMKKMRCVGPLRTHGRWLYPVGQSSEDVGFYSCFEDVEAFGRAKF